MYGYDTPLFLLFQFFYLYLDLAVLLTLVARDPLFSRIMYARYRSAMHWLMMKKNEQWQWKGGGIRDEEGGDSMDM